MTSSKGVAGREGVPEAGGKTLDSFHVGGGANYLQPCRPNLTPVGWRPLTQEGELRAGPGEVAEDARRHAQADRTAPLEQRACLPANARRLQYFAAQGRHLDSVLGIKAPQRRSKAAFQADRSGTSVSSRSKKTARMVISRQFSAVSLIQADRAVLPTDN
jgi:hypothetical protein